jgi:hypothetical protein
LSKDAFKKRIRKKKSIDNVSKLVLYLTVDSFTLVGTKGSLKLPFPMWSPTALVKEEGTREFPLPEGSKHKVEFDI